MWRIRAFEERVGELTRVDFLTLALDQLVNTAAKAHFMSGGQLQVPLVLRTQGARASAAARSTRRASRRGSATSPASRS